MSPATCLTSPHHFILTRSRVKRAWFCPHLTQKDAKARRGEATCPRHMERGRAGIRTWVAWLEELNHTVNGQERGHMLSTGQVSSEGGVLAERSRPGTFSFVNDEKAKRQTETVSQLQPRLSVSLCLHRTHDSAAGRCQGLPSRTPGSRGRRSTNAPSRFWKQASMKERRSRLLSSLLLTVHIYVALYNCPTGIEQTLPGGVGVARASCSGVGGLTCRG